MVLKLQGACTELSLQAVTTRTTWTPTSFLMLSRTLYRLFESVGSLRLAGLRMFTLESNIPIGMPVARAMGLLKELAVEVLKAGGKRLEWSCLDWNEPSLQFYESEVIGAKRKKEWIGLRVEGDELSKLANS